jgi:catechol 2,3-dioxygenase-like lactoylglutathione lyase family enzyme
MTMPPVATRLNHVAYPTFDTSATVRFYTEVMGFRLVDAVRDRIGRHHFLHTFFAMASGEIIAFFDVRDLEKPGRDGIPHWVRHLALSVESADALAEWRTRLTALGVEVSGPIDHDGIWSSIYFSDPNDVMLELTHQRRPLNDDDAARATTLVAEWTAERPAGEIRR